MQQLTNNAQLNDSSQRFLVSQAASSPRSTAVRAAKRGPAIPTWTILLAMVLLCASWGAGAALAQGSEQLPDSAIFGEEVDVRVVNVEVVVTNRRGERVSGLAAGDFQLLVDGREVPIEFFSEVRGGVAAAAAGQAGSTVPAQPPGKAVGTRYLVFIDDFFSIPSDRNRVLKNLEQQLTMLGPEDRMAVVAYDGRRLDLLSSWSDSPRQLARVLAQARERRAFGLHRLGEQRRYDALQRFQRTGSALGFAGIGFRGAVGSRLDAQDLQRSKEVASQVERAVSAAAATLRGFAQPAGRKVMLMLSGEWPASGISWVTGNYVRGLEQSSLAGGWGTFRPLIDSANRLGYTLYPVDVSGRSAIRFEEASARSYQDGVAGRTLARERELVSEDTFLEVAKATGGHAFLDGSGLHALARTVEDTRSYYWLGFTPTWRGDDQRHNLQVRPRIKGFKARSRTSFSDLSRRSATTMMVESAQIFDSPLPGALALQVRQGAQRSGGLGKMLVPLELSIPLDQVTRVPRGDGWVSRLELRVAATEDSGERAEIPVIPVLLSGDGSPTDGEVAVYETTLRLRRQPHRVHLALYDPLSGQMLAKRMHLTP